MFRRSLGGSLSILYFLANVAFVHAGESNFWKERQEKNTEKKPTQLASVEGLNLNNPQNLLKQFPALSKSLDAISAAQPDSISKLKLPDSVAPFMEAIPLNHGLIKDVHLAKPMDNKPAPMVVLVQDVHMNNEAQENIAAILLSLNNKAYALSPKNPLVVGVEGAFGPFDFGPFRAFEDKELVKSVADYFLKENKFAAPSFTGITVENPATTFFGIDDNEHYRANVEAYRSSQAIKKHLAEKLEEGKRDLAAKKRDALNTELLKFDAKKTGHENGKIGFGEFIEYLSKTADARDLEKDGRELVIEQFMAAYQIEKSLNFEKVERERTRVIERLAANLTKTEINDLLAQGLAFRLGRISFAGYYRAIKALVQKHHIALSDTPSFDTYIRYVLLSDGLQIEPLMAAVNRLEEKVLVALIRTPDEQKLMDQSRWNFLVEKLLDFSLIPEEWEEYEKVVSGSWYLGLSKNNPFSIKRQDLASFENFYREADIRSEKMVENLQNASNTELGTSAAIVGGFHTSKLKQILRKKGFSYAVVQPKLTKIEGVTGTEYLSVFTREKTPLDKLFEGSKLFLALNSQAVGDRSSIEANPAANEVIAVNRAVQGFSEPGVTSVNVGGGLLATTDIDGAPEGSVYKIPQGGIPSFRIMAAGFLQRLNTRPTKFIPKKLKDFITDVSFGQIDWNENAISSLSSFIRGYVIAEAFYHAWTTSRAQKAMNIPFLGFGLRLIDALVGKVVAIILAILLRPRLTQNIGLRLLVWFLPVKIIGDSNPAALSPSVQRNYASRRTGLTPSRNDLMQKLMLIKLISSQSKAINLGLSGTTITNEEIPEISEENYLVASFIKDDGSTEVVSLENPEKSATFADKTKANVMVLNPQQNNFEQRALLAKTLAANGVPVMIYAPNLTEEQRSSLGKAQVISELSIGAIEAAAEAGEWTVKSVSLQILSKNIGFFDRSLITQVNSLYDSYRAQNTPVDMFMGMILNQNLILVPVTKGDLERLLELEQKVQKMIQVQA